jgi:DNA-binding NtrC family response regulator
MRKAIYRAPLALVVEQDANSREHATILLKETGLDVITCGSGTAAVAVLQRCGSDVAMLLTGSTLQGSMDGKRLAKVVRKLWPRVHLVVGSGTPERCREHLPEETSCIRRPWLPLDIIIQAHASRHLMAFSAR